MKQKFFNTILFITIACIAREASAQETSVDVTKVPAKRNQSIEKLSNATGTCTVALRCTATYCDIVFKSPKDASAGMAARKNVEVYSFAWRVSSTDNTVTEITDPKDLAASSASSKSASKVSFSDIRFSVTCNGKIIPVVVEDGVYNFPPNLPDGVYYVYMKLEQVEKDDVAKVKDRHPNTNFICTIKDGAFHSIYTKGIGTAG